MMIKSYDEIIAILAEEYYSNRMSGSSSPWATLHGKIAMVALIYGANEDDIYLQVEVRAYE